LETVDRKYLLPTKIIDSDHATITTYAQKITRGDGEDHVAKAVSLYYAVRDDIWYDPYYPFYLPEHYQASNVLASGRGYCVCKAALLCAVGRAVGIPSRIGFATVRNHLATRQLLEFLGSDLFVYHGFTEFFLEGKWVKATPAFNIELCQRHKVDPLEFNGREDSVFHAFNQEQQQFMEYLEDHGSFADVPLDEILAAWRQTYGSKRVDTWIAALEKAAGQSSRDFYTEDLVYNDNH
jgi:transglutaminase-like putative cysteine protease